MFTPKTTVRATPGSSKTCLFCGRGGKMSKEHLWPRWAQAAIAPDQRGKKIRNALHDGPPGDPYEVWEAPVLKATIKDVCVECNRGWMSKIEAAAKPFALPLMLGRSIALAPETPRKLAIWPISSARSMLRLHHPLLDRLVDRVQRDAADLDG